SRLAAKRRNEKAGLNPAMWSRVFGRSDVAPDPAALLAHLHGIGIPVTIGFRGDDLGWTGAELTIVPGATPVYVERYLTGEDDLRDDLNTWAAWLETQDHEPRHRALMEHVVAARQLVT